MRFVFLSKTSLQRIWQYKFSALYSCLVLPIGTSSTKRPVKNYNGELRVRLQSSRPPPYGRVKSTSLDLERVENSQTHTILYLSLTRRRLSLSSKLHHIDGSLRRHGTWYRSSQDVSKISILTKKKKNSLTCRLFTKSRPPTRTMKKE